MSTSEAGHGVMDLTFSKPPQTPTKEDALQIIQNYPAEDLNALLECIDMRGLQINQPSGRIQKSLEAVTFQAPQRNAYAPDRKAWKAGDFLGVIIIEDAGDTRVNGRYIKTHRLHVQRAIYLHEANPQIKIIWSSLIDCWTLDDVASTPYKIVKDVKQERRQDLLFPYEGVWEVHQNGLLPVPLTRKTCFHFRGNCRVPTSELPHDDLTGFVKLTKKQTHPLCMLETQTKWPGGGGWGPPNMHKPLRSTSFHLSGKNLTMKWGAQTMRAGTAPLPMGLTTGSSFAGATLLPSQVKKGMSSSSPSLRQTR